MTSRCSTASSARRNSVATIRRCSVSWSYAVNVMKSPAPRSGGRTTAYSRRGFMGQVLGVSALGKALRTQGGVAPKPKAEYGGPNVVLIRFGGGARRRESIESATTYAPFLAKVLAKKGTLFPRMEIAQIKGLNTSHGEGTLNLITGRYDQYRDVENRFLSARFEPKVPTLFEYLRKTFAVPPHQTLLVNGEDRPDEEFYTFSNHAGYGIDYRSNVLSLYRFKRWLFEQELDEGALNEDQIRKREQTLAKWEKADPRARGRGDQGPELARFWREWREHYGDSGFVNPRGDRLLTALALRALKQLRPRLLMINYNDCDYVHWGLRSHYTRGIAIMDQGIRRISEAIDHDPFYRSNTLLVVVPDCGRDNNLMAEVPFQHHFNSRSSHEIFALFVGPGVPRGAIVDKPCDQVSVAPTVGRLMGFETSESEGVVLEETFS